MKNCVHKIPHQTSHAYPHEQPVVGTRVFPVRAMCICNMHQKEGTCTVERRSVHPHAQWIHTRTERTKLHVGGGLPPHTRAMPRLKYCTWPIHVPACTRTLRDRQSCASDKTPAHATHKAQPFHYTEGAGGPPTVFLRTLKAPAQ